MNRQSYHNQFNTIFIGVYCCTSNRPAVFGYKLLLCALLDFPLSEWPEWIFNSHTYTTTTHWHYPQRTRTCVESGYHTISLEPDYFALSPIFCIYTLNKSKYTYYSAVYIHHTIYISNMYTTTAYKYLKHGIVVGSDDSYKLILWKFTCVVRCGKCKRYTHAVIWV